ncbi:chondroitinase-B domain-containing protein [Bacteroidota bacterium]
MIRVLFLLLACISFPAFSQVKHESFEAFKNACIAAQPGDEIILSAGRYEAESIKLEGVAGTAENPVIIRAEEIGADTLDVGTYFDLRHCSYVSIQGFVINISEKSTTFKIQTCNNIRITQNILDGSGESYLNDDGDGRNSSVWISIQSLWDDPTGLSHHNRIDHNRFQNKHTLGNMIRIDGTDEKYVSQYDVIEYNHFKNMGPRAENEMEAIRIGWSAMSESDGLCTVSNNLFEACNGDPEIISVKCNKNTLAHNTFLRCQGTLSLRHGNESLVEGNFFLGDSTEGTGGVRIYGSDHRIINNYFEGLTGTRWDAPITLTEGDAEEGNGSLSKHFRIERAIIANNTLVNNDHGIEIGYDNNDKYSKPPRDVVMANNLVTSDTGSLVSYINPPDNISWSNNLMFARGVAVLGNGVSFGTEEVLETDPLLTWNSEELVFRAAAETPGYTATFDITGAITYDMDGQLRSSTTQYGADEYQTSTILYSPLKAIDVGPDLGEYLQLSAASFPFPVGRDTMQVSISSNLDWEASTGEAWIILDPIQGSGDGVIGIIVAENETGLERSGTVIIQSTNAIEGENITRNILVSQAESEPPVLTLSASELAFTSEPGEKSLEITSNVDWTANSESDWIFLSPEAGSGSNSLLVNIEANESRAARKGSLTVCDGKSLVQNIEVYQEGSVGSEVKLVIVDAIASTEQAEKGNIAENVYDGLLSNRWSGEGDGAYISIELEELSKISYLKVGLYKGSERNSYFDLQSSTDGIEYFDLLMGITSDLSEEALVIYDFPDTTARYIRLVGHGNSTSAWNSYTEFEAWGWKPSTGIQDHINSNPLECLVFPNPSDGHFNIISKPKTSLTLYNLSGRIIDKLYMEGEMITPVRNLSPGFYILLAKNGKESSLHKIIIK